MRRSLIKTPQLAVVVPPITPTMAWYDPSDPATIHATGALIDQLDDKSGNGRHLAATGALRPSTGLNTINGLNAITGLSTTGLRRASVSVAQPVTLFVVAKLTTAGAGNKQIIQCNAASGAHCLLVFSAATWCYFGGSVINSGVTADTAVHLHEAIFSGAASLLNLDGASISTANPGVGGGVEIILGSIASAGWPGLTGEVLLYNTALSSPNRDSIRAYLKAKWGTP